MTRRRAFVICPGRGTYNRDELGYLRRHHTNKPELLEMVDAYRESEGKTSVSALDGAKQYSAADHGRGDNASALIYTCAYADFLEVCLENFDIVAISGNSMGWYIALACGGSVTAHAGFKIVDTMGSLMHEHGIGGQLVYPIVGADWRELPGKRTELLALVADIDNRPGHEASLSINLGGMLVFAGNELGLAALVKALPPLEGRYPMRLSQHAAFHSPLQNSIAERGQLTLPVSLFAAPTIPMIDGRGHIWRPYETRSTDLHAYTLGEQVTTPYDFARAIRTGLHEFAPDALIVLGPGTTLGSSVAQVLIADQWHGLHDKASFQTLQQSDPLLLSMAMPTQRTIALGQRK